MIEKLHETRNNVECMSSIDREKKNMSLLKKKVKRREKKK